MSPAVVRFEGVTASYRGSRTPALREATFEIDAAVTFLVGENGAGKTTLFRLVLGALRPSAGTITRSWEGFARPGADAGVGYAPQEFRLPDHVTVVAYLRYLAYLKRIQRTAVPAAVEAASDAVGLAEVLDRPLGRLSGGWRRRVGLAQAVLGSPRIVLLDEPTASLDPASRVAVRASLARMAGSARLVVSTHLTEDLDLLVPDPDLLVLHQGAVAFQGRKADLPAVGADRLSHASSDEARLIAVMRREQP